MVNNHFYHNACISNVKTNLLQQRELTLIAFTPIKLKTTYFTIVSDFQQHLILY